MESFQSGEYIISEILLLDHFNQKQRNSAESKMAESVKSNVNINEVVSS